MSFRPATSESIMHDCASFVSSLFLKFLKYFLYNSLISLNLLRDPQLNLTGDACPGNMIPNLNFSSLKKIPFFLNKNNLVFSPLFSIWDNTS